MSLLLLWSGLVHADESIEKPLSQPDFTQNSVIGSNDIDSKNNKSSEIEISLNSEVDGEIDEAGSSQPSIQASESSSLESTPVPATKVGKHVNEEMDLLSMILSLSVVLAIIGVSAFLLKRIQGVKTPLNGLKLVSSLHLGTKEKIVVVQAGEQQWLLGVTPQQINLLSELAEPLTSNTEQAPTLPSAIASLLKKSSSK